MGRITKVIGFSVSPALAEEVEQVAKAERRYRLLISPAIVNEVGRVLRETFGLEERVRILRLKMYQGIPIVRPIDFLRTLGLA